MKKSRIEFQVVKSSPGAEIAVPTDRRSNATAIHTGLAVGVLAISIASALSGYRHDQKMRAAHLADSAEYGASAVVSSLAGDRALLKGQSSILVEDPRLKATLATEGIDRASITDILADLETTADIRISAILSREGRVLAHVGAPLLAKLDLHSSAVFKEAKPGAPSADSWVLGQELISVAIAPITSDDRVIAHLLLGRGFAESALKEAARISDTSGALQIAGKTVLSAGPENRAAFEAASTLPAGPAADVEGCLAHVVEVGEPARGARFVFLADPAAHSHLSEIAFAWVPTISLLAAGAVMYGMRRKG